MDRREKLKQLVKNLNLKNRVIFCGTFNPNNIWKVMKEFDYFINTSDFEGFP